MNFKMLHIAVVPKKKRNPRFGVEFKHVIEKRAIV
jgi:hypothetical protein